MRVRILFFIVVTVLGSVIQLLAASTGSVAGCLISAVIVSILSHVLWRFSDLGSRQLAGEVIPAGAAFAGIAAGTVFRLLQQDVTPLIGTGLAAGAFTSVMAMWLRPRGLSETCFQHGGRFTTLFQCPRCRQKFCGNSDCWDARGVRCQQCRRNEVLLSNPRNESWWVKRFGNRITTGSCMRCLTVASNADVHECGQCHWQVCRRCWDLDNCQCRKCGWMPEGLPEALTILLPPTRVASHQASRKVVAGRNPQHR